jgi:thioredoxin-like negative regulator of GroEL
MNIPTLAELQAVITQKKYVFIDCFTTWCGPCKTFSALVEKEVMSMITGRSDTAFVQLDIEESPEITQWVAQFHIDVVPSVIAFKEGKHLHVTYTDCRSHAVKENVPVIRGNALNIAEIVKDIIK